MDIVGEKVYVEEWDLNRKEKNIRKPYNILLEIGVKYDIMR